LIYVLNERNGLNDLGAKGVGLDSISVNININISIDLTFLD
jgi:hypothetical protein